MFVTGNSDILGYDSCINNIGTNSSLFKFPLINKFKCLMIRFELQVDGVVTSCLETSKTFVE